MDGSSVRLRGNRSVCREGIKPICLTIHKVLALTSGSTQHVQYVELCCIYWIFIHIPVRWVMRATDIFDDIMVILRIVIMLNDLNPFRFFTMRQNSRKLFFKCREWNDPLEFLKCNERLNTGRPAGACPCVGGGVRRHGVRTTGQPPAVEELDHPQEAAGEIPHRITQFPVSPDLYIILKTFPNSIWKKMLNGNVRESQGIYIEYHCDRVVSSWRSCGPFCCSWDWCGCGGSTLCTASTNVRTRHRKCLNPHLYS